VILGVLRAVLADSVQTHGAHLSAELDEVERLWKASCLSARDEETPRAADRLDRLATRLHSKLRDALPAAARYRDSVHEGARVVAPKLADANYDASPDGCAGVVEALNGAWLARLEAGADQVLRARVTTNARALLDALVADSPAERAA
jgi:hypothetical protein